MPANVWVPIPPPSQAWTQVNPGASNTWTSIPA